MKILISSDGQHAHYYQRMAWAAAFLQSELQVYVWDCKNVTAFDVFDSIEPDIFLGQGYNLDVSLLKCIYERPHLKVGLRAGDWGDHQESVDNTKYNILYCTQKEKDILKKLKDETGKPDFVHILIDGKIIKRLHQAPPVRHFKNQLPQGKFRIFLFASFNTQSARSRLLKIARLRLTKRFK